MFPFIRKEFSQRQRVFSRSFCAMSASISVMQPSCSQPGTISCAAWRHSALPFSRVTPRPLRRISCTSLSGGALQASVDAALLASLVEAAKAARLTADLDENVNVEQLMLIPGVVVSAVPDADSPGMAEAYERAVSSAIAEYQAMRQREGEALKRELESREQGLETLVSQIEPLVAEINGAIKARLLEKLSAEKIPTPADDERLLKEVLFYADKSDVTEELTRLHSHFGQFRRFLAEETKPVGRSLDFLMQELFREITTLGNKAGIPAVSPLVVAFKSECEKLREQIQNVE